MIRDAATRDERAQEHIAVALMDFAEQIEEAVTMQVVGENNTASGATVHEVIPSGGKPSV